MCVKAFLDFFLLFFFSLFFFIFVSSFCFFVSFLFSLFIFFFLLSFFLQFLIVSFFFFISIFQGPSWAPLGPGSLILHGDDPTLAGPDDSGTLEKHAFAKKFNYKKVSSHYQEQNSPVFHIFQLCVDGKTKHNCYFKAGYTAPQQQMVGWGR